MKTIIFILVIFGSMIAHLPGQTAGYEFTHQSYDSLLHKYVNDQGLVNYRDIKSNPDLLQEYLRQLTRLDASEFESWNKHQKMAFWINAYNAITIAGILENYPIEYGNLISRARFPKNSIRQIGGFWDKVFIQVMNQDITLNEIEHEILRKKYQDPRIHAVLVCAAIGCPLLENRAFYPETLDARLDEANRDFINNPDKVKLDKKNNVLYLSSIMDWYKEDYPAISGDDELLQHYSQEIRGVIEFVIKYISNDKKEFILANYPKIKFLDYDWILNEQ
jgi:hypothetical protein